MRRREFVKLMATAAGAATLPGCSPLAPAGEKKPGAPRVLVVAFDGLDPRLLQSLLAAGRLPHFQRLAAQGGWRPLATTTPPQTPVAFATMITGTDPDAHGVFDFIQRDPRPSDAALAVRPFLSTAEAVPPGEGWSMSLGGWEIPLAASRMQSLRRGAAFWETLASAGIDTDVYFLPANFPCAPVAGPGRLRAMGGMGVPDLLGTHGEFTLFSSALKSELKQVSGGRFVKLRVARHGASAELWGPLDWNSTSAAVSAGDGLPPRMKARMSIQRDPHADLVLVRLGSEQRLLQRGQWSDWLPVEFVSALPAAKWLGKLGTPTTARGMARVYVKRVHPALELYVSPVQLDPLDATAPLSSPADFARALALRHGRFSTLGIPEDTKAFTHGALSAGEFIAQAALASQERLKLWRAALADFRAGCLCFYFGASDLMQHMFWRDHDPAHPAHDAELAARHGPIVPDQYEQADARVGEALAALEPEDTLLVFSDHGFTSFKQGFHLNSWLAQQGYLRVSDPGRLVRAATGGMSNDPRRGEPGMFAGVDWRYSRAYGLGMNGLYLNLRDREKFGQVDAADRKALCAQLREELMQVKDREGTPVFDQIDCVGERFPAADPQSAPDLILGYADGFRASWDTVLGGIPTEILEINREQWSGEHLISARLTPGMLASNRQVVVDHPHLRDLAPTILGRFGVDVPTAMTGRDLFSV